jgi:hypothetical protein
MPIVIAVPPRLLPPIAPGEGNPLPLLHLLVNVDVVHSLNPSRYIFISIHELSQGKHSLPPPNFFPDEPAPRSAAASDHA